MLFYLVLFFFIYCCRYITLLKWLSLHYYYIITYFNVIRETIFLIQFQTLHWLKMSRLPGRVIMINRHTEIVTTDLLFLRYNEKSLFT